MPQELEDSKAPSTVARHRRSLAFLANVMVIAIAYTMAFLLRFDFNVPQRHIESLLLTLPAAVIVHYAAFTAFKVTRGWWRYVSIGDFVSVLRASVIGGLGLATYVFLFHRDRFFPRAVFLLNFVMVVGLSIGARLVVRLWRQIPRHDSGGRKRLLIVGAGDTAEALLREIRQGSGLKYRPVAVLDDDPLKHGMYLNGVPVLGAIASAPDIVRRLSVDEIVIATPSASGQEMRRIIEICQQAAVPFKVMPATSELLSKRGGISPRQVEINDLLRREPIKLDTVGIGRFLRGRCVLVTGAAGSIGSEIARQVLGFSPRALLCLDHDENALFFLERVLGTSDGATEISYKLGDITDSSYINHLFQEHTPDVIFHAAAHKHVGMLESNPLEGVRNNVFGTEIVAAAAGRHGASAFVLVSTDKAVNPTSVMGATKRVAELLIQTLPFETRYTAVRFGNVLGSQGSVVPILKEQIAAGGPVTITHPEMRRFFMTIPEAVQLVIQAGAMGKENEILMLDMGEPVRITDLTNDLIRLSGLRPGVDIAITYTGIRPGEKLSEELYLESEQADATTHPKILVARRSRADREVLTTNLAKLRRALDAHDEDGVRGVIGQLVPEYRRPGEGAQVIPLHAVKPSA